MSRKTHVELVTEFGSKAVKRFPSGFQLDNIMDATMEVMRDVSTLYYLHGKEKKQLVIDILIHVVHNTDAGALNQCEPAHGGSSEGAGYAGAYRYNGRAATSRFRRRLDRGLRRLEL